MDLNMMIGAAKEACQRRRILVQKLYEIKLERENVIRLSQQSQSKELDLKLVELTKKMETLIDEVGNSSNILDQEIKLFRANKEVEIQQIMADFVNIQRKASLDMQSYWTHFLNKGEA